MTLSTPQNQSLRVGPAPLSCIQLLIKVPKSICWLAAVRSALLTIAVTKSDDMFGLVSIVATWFCAVCAELCKTILCTSMFSCGHMQQPVWRCSCIVVTIVWSCSAHTRGIVSVCIWRRTVHRVEWGQRGSFAQEMVWSYARGIEIVNACCIHSLKLAAAQLYCLMFRATC